MWKCSDEILRPIIKYFAVGKIKKNGVKDVGKYQLGESLAIQLTCL